MKRLVSRIICLVLIVISFSMHYVTSCSYLEEITREQEELIVHNELITNEPVPDKQSEVTGSSVEEIQLYATSAVLLDGSSGRVLYGKNETQEMPMASTTKIMTCICALENGNLEDAVTISAKAAKQPKVRLGVQEGEQYLLKDLLYSLMLESHNDVAVAIAEHISGSVEEFAKLMNQKALDLGLTNTYFITPNGLDGNVTTEDGEVISHHTTAEELAKMMVYCVSQSKERGTFLEITRTESYQFTNCDGSKSHNVSNHNAFLTMMDGALSGKTGFTNKAGYCYVGALQRDDRLLIVALLACGWPNNKNYKWSDTKTLMNYGLEHFSYEERMLSNYVVELGAVPVYGSSCFADCPVYLELSYEDETFSLLKSASEHEIIETELKSCYKAPVLKDDYMGVMKYQLGGRIIKTFAVRSSDEIKEKTLGSSMKEMFIFTLKNGF